jgi:hypothetical protein
MQPVKVPQNLELRDVLAWGLGAIDLLCLAAAGVVGWWLIMAVPAPFVVRVAMASPVFAIGLALGMGRLGGRTVRDWVVVVAGYVLRPRRRVYGDER